MTEWFAGSIRLELRTEPDATTDDDPAVWRAEIDGHRCRTERQFLSEIGAALEFPTYYGHNWDAFDECFRDLLDVTDGGMGHEFYDRPGRAERVLHLVVTNADQLLDYAAPRFLTALMGTFRQPHPRYDPPRLWNNYAGLRVTLRCSAEAHDILVSRLRDAGLFRADGVLP